MKQTRTSVLALALIATAFHATMNTGGGAAAAPAKKASGKKAAAGKKPAAGKKAAAKPAKKAAAKPAAKAKPRR
jgi:hypothetical protein